MKLRFRGLKKNATQLFAVRAGESVLGAEKTVALGTGFGLAVREATEVGDSSGGRPFSGKTPF